MFHLYKPWENLQPLKVAVPPFSVGPDKKPALAGLELPGITLVRGSWGLLPLNQLAYWGSPTIDQNREI